MRILTYMIFIAIISFAACEQDPMDQIIEGELGVLSISMDVYSIPSEVAQINGELFRSGAEPIFFDFEMSDCQASALVEGIEVGKWHLKVNALNSIGDIVYAGTTSVDISAGETSSVRLHLSKTGSLEIVVTWEAAVLAAYYLLNGDALDHSGNGHHGMVHGASPTYDRFGHPEGAYYFDGIDDVISLDPYIYNGKTISLSAWIKKLGDGPDHWNSVLAGDCSTPYFGFDGNVPTFGGQCEIPMDHQYSDYQLTDSSWHHMVGIYNGSHIQLYFDTHQLINEYVGNHKFDNSIPIGIGGSYMHFRDLEGFFGMIDDVRIYDGVLSGNEIESLYYEGMSIIPVDGLIAYYPFNGNANDETGYGNHGVVYGASLSKDRFGDRDKAYSFNGRENYIGIPHDPSIHPGSEDFAITLWLRYNSTEGEQVLIEKWIQSRPKPEGWTLTKLEGNVIRFAYCELVECNVDTQPMDIALDTWHHCAISRNQGTISIYWDGELITSGLMEEANGLDLSSEVAIKLGHRGSPENTPGSVDRGGFFLDGHMDDVRIYNKGLTSEQIRTIYYAEKQE